MSKRKNGDGSWGTKTVNGITYKKYRSPEGKDFYGKTEKEVQAKIKAYSEGNLVMGKEALARLSFGKFVMSWLENIHKNKIKEKTYDEYEIVIDRCLIKYKEYDLASTQLGTLDDTIFNAYFDKARMDFSRSTLHTAYVVMDMALDYAVASKHILAANPMQFVSLPIEESFTKKTRTVPFLSESDMDKLYMESKRINKKGMAFGKIGQPVYGNNAQLIIAIMYTGLRMGEAVGLKKSSVDLPGKTITIENNIIRIKNRGDDSERKYIEKDGTPKRKASYRTIPLCDRAYEAIEYFMNLDNTSEYVFVNKNGTRIKAENVGRTLKNMLIRADCDVKACGPHSLRHSFGSYLILHGTPLVTVSKLLGHADIGTTANVYVHIINEQKANAVKLFNEPVQSKI